MVKYTNDQKVIDKLYGIIRDDAKSADRAAFKSYFITEDEPLSHPNTIYFCQDEQML
jgi:hypothetical protein